jgi:hypothetical protein
MDKIHDIGKGVYDNPGNPNSITPGGTKELALQEAQWAHFALCATVGFVLSRGG